MKAQSLGMDSYLSSWWQIVESSSLSKVCLEPNSHLGHRSRGTYRRFIVNARRAWVHDSTSAHSLCHERGSMTSQACLTADLLGLLVLTGGASW
jgi:hypothetical protein